MPAISQVQPAIRSEKRTMQAGGIGGHIPTSDNGFFVVGHAVRIRIRVLDDVVRVRFVGEDAVVVERQTAKTEPPRMYQVVMLNDDYTPMEFVVMVLQEYFKRDLETATQIMLKIHHDGRGVCGVYSKDVAATKVELVLAAARRGGYPLQCIMEAA